MATYRFTDNTGKTITIGESVSYGASPALSDSDVNDIIDYIQTSFSVVTTISYATKEPDTDWFIAP